MVLTNSDGLTKRVDSLTDRAPRIRLGGELIDIVDLAKTLGWPVLRDPVLGFEYVPEYYPFNSTQNH